MAVRAQYLSHAFPHDHRAVIRPAALDNNAMSASVFLGGGGGHPLAAAVGGNTVLSDLTCNNNNINCCFSPRKRARVGDDVAGAGLIMDVQGQQGALLPPVPLPAGDVQQSRLLCSAAASTSGHPTASVAPPVSQGLLSHLHSHGVEIDALVRIENERLRAGLQEARRRHVRTVVVALERAAARRLRAAEAELGRALARNAELDERLRQTEAEGHAWQDIARCHEGVAAGLRATLDNLMQTQSPCAGAEGDAEDAQSCCFDSEQEREREQDRGAEEASGGGRRTRACRWCGAAEACVLLLPCRHLCLCRGCEAGVGACPVCAATKNAALHVLLR